MAAAGPEQRHEAALRQVEVEEVDRNWPVDSVIVIQRPRHPGKLWVDHVVETPAALLESKVAEWETGAAGFEVIDRRMVLLFAGRQHFVHATLPVLRCPQCRKLHTGPQYQIQAVGQGRRWEFPGVEAIPFGHGLSNWMRSS